MMESSREIEKMFNRDNSRLKRIGSNVHRRAGKGSDRAGVAGGVRFAKTKFKKYEKNSRVSTSNMYDDILPFKEYKKLDRETQADLMEEWLKRHSKTKIRKEMAISHDRLNTLIGGFELEKITKEISSKGGITMVDQQLTVEQAKEKVIPKHELYRFDEADRFEIVHYYNKVLKVNNKDLAERWSIKDASSLGSMKSNWKKAFIEDGRDIEDALKPLSSRKQDKPQEKLEESNTAEDASPSGDAFSGMIESPAQAGKTENLNSLIGEYIDEYQVSDSENETINDIEDSFNLSDTVEPMDKKELENNIVFAVNGQYKGYELRDKLQGIKDLLESNKTYNIQLSVKQTDSGGSNKELMDMLRRIMEEIK